MISASDLHVISVISNPVRYQTRIKLFQEFMERMKHSGVTHWIVEATFGEREPTVVDPNDPHHIIVRCDHELWLKENLLNVGARHLPPDAKYVMWCDGDIRFERPDWAIETVQQLQHYDAVQPFSHIVDYGLYNEIMETQKGFAYCYVEGDRLHPNSRADRKYGGPFWHPGYAWAFRMDAWNAVGGMIDKGICGAGDFHMATALIGQCDLSLDGLHENYKHYVRNWQELADRHIKRNIGYVPGTVLHYYHGKKADRKYQTRRQILIGHEYDPYTDVIYNRHGVLQLNLQNDERGRRFRDDLRGYFRARNEDGTY